MDGKLNKSELQCAIEALQFQMQEQCATATTITRKTLGIYPCAVCKSAHSKLKKILEASK
jgi:hypothetical protein